jgi:ribosome-binding protein aMBF1 (putative translation factor)
MKNKVYELASKCNEAHHAVSVYPRLQEVHIDGFRVYKYPQAIKEMQEMLEISLLQAMQNKDEARIQSIEKAAEAGEIVRIM